MRAFIVYQEVKNFDIRTIIKYKLMLKVSLLIQKGLLEENFQSQEISFFDPTVTRLLLLELTHTYKDRINHIEMYVW